jgi:hypothetical protein
MKKHSITIPLMGGLGNQLFQLAASIYLEEIHHRSIVFDTSLLDSGSRNTSRPMMIHELIDTEQIICTQRLQLLFSFLRGKVQHNYWVRERTIGELPFHNVGDRTQRVSGYFQSFTLVKAVWPTLLHRISQSPTFAPLSEDRQRRSIAVHMRYGDYRINANALAFHGLTLPEYYCQSVALLQDNLGCDRVEIISDEPERAIKDFLTCYQGEVSQVTAVSGTEFDHLRTLASASGVVTSNSTFSWWGAWFADQFHGSAIVYPSPWFAKAEIVDPPLFPVRWMAMDRTFTVSNQD